MKRPKLTLLLFVVFMLMLILPLFHTLVPFGKIAPLKGAVQTTEKPEWSFEKGYEGSYQTQFESWFNDELSLKPWLIRLRNQLLYSLFNKASARGVIRGKENYLYEIAYIDAYYGRDYRGMDILRTKVAGIKSLQDYLESQGKTILVCLAPGKASFYPEFIPDDLRGEPTDSTNYLQFVQLMQAEGVNHLDLNAWFMEQKDQSDCLLYPQYGIHWSYYGMTQAVNQLAVYIETLRGWKLPRIEITAMERSSTLRYADYDIGQGMNLMFNMKAEPMCYPEFLFTQGDTLFRPKTIVVADSYYWSMHNAGVSTNLFGHGEFWYYNQKVYHGDHSPHETVSEIDFQSRLTQTDLVVILITEANLKHFSWGFVEQALTAVGF